MGFGVKPREANAPRSHQKHDFWKNDSESHFKPFRHATLIKIPPRGSKGVYEPLKCLHVDAKLFRKAEHRAKPKNIIFAAFEG